MEFEQKLKALAKVIKAGMFVESLTEEENDAIIEHLTELENLIANEEKLTKFEKLIDSEE